MSKIEQGRYSDLLRRILGMTGSSVVAGELSPEISPGLSLEEERPEWEFLKGAKLMCAPLNIAGGVGTQTGFRFRNPANSGVVAIFGHLTPIVDIITDAGAGAPSLVQFQRRTDDTINLATTVSGIPRDTRYPSAAANQSAIIGSQTNNLGATNQGDIWHGGVSLNNLLPFQLTGSFVLTPGNQFNISIVTNNVSTRGGLWWLEKRFDQLEAS